MRDDEVYWVVLKDDPDAYFQCRIVDGCYQLIESGRRLRQEDILFVDNRVGIE